MSKILFATGLRDDWGLYMPHLLEVAKARNASIHVLETAAPIGTGDFTVNPVQNDPVPLQTPDPTIPDVNPEDRQTAPDIAVAAHQTNVFVDQLVKYFQEAGFQATGDWQPDFNREHLGIYARQVNADLIAIVKHGWLAELFQGGYVGKLRDDGFEVLELEPVKG
ncbi:MAG TPA: hypothetical protein VNT60_06465 [Deinococcales bacterium]|nr:hypothetical protein [Deinococcales bacterium]